MSEEKEVVVLEQESPFIVVGIDYGTTYSGAAWAKSGTLDRTEVIADWSTHTVGGSDSEKVPSDICYDEHGRPWKWGFGLKDEDNPLRWAKLLLSPLSLTNMTSSEERVVEATRLQLKKLKKTAVEVISDYLRFLWRHILERLRIRLTAPALDNMALKIVLTIPAIWDHNAQDQMLAAARMAGMLEYRSCGQTEITLLAEPAAAALATYFDSEIKLNPIVKVGDSFVVCDAGGGTVDLISYTINRFDPIFQLKECIGATGDLCGAVYIDRAFLNLVKTMRKYMQTLDSGQTRRFMDREWEQGVKKNFDNASGPWHIELPQNLHRPRLSVLRKPKSNILTLENEHLQQVFNEVVPKIVDLLRDQVEGIKGATGRPPKVIILVGGFGGNKYLLQLIRDRFGPEILIQQPIKAWSAVCRGAVQRGATGGGEIVCNHISKYSYGVTHLDDWDPKRYLQVDKIFDERLQSDQAKNQMRWYLKKHDDVNQVQKVEHEFRSILRDARQLRAQNYVIYYSDRDNPGTRLAIDHVRKLCTLHMDMSDFDFKSFPKFVNNIGKEYRNVDSCLTMDVTVSSVDWSVVCQGKPVKVRVEYEDIISAAKIPT